jgi:N-terminal acetyltransferase B complex non-catalytic subunit
MTGNFASNPDYTLWSIMTVILQIRDLKHPQSDPLLSLAERQASKYFEKQNEYKTSDEFHIVTRLLELRALLSNSSSTPSTSTSSTFPSLRPSESPRSPSPALLEHFASSEGNKWCESNLGFDLWRRETELQFGTVEGGEWENSWKRLKGILEAG